MPMIEISLTPGAVADDAARDKLVEDLSTALLRAERAPDNPVTRAITWAWVDDGRAFYVGGRREEEARVRVAITTPEGALSDRRRAELVENASRIAAEAIGAAPEDATRVWVTLHEVAEGSWGAGGRIYRFRDIAGLVAAGEPASD